MKNGRKIFYTSVFFIILSVLVPYICSCFLLQVLWIQGDSMAPTYHNGEIAIIDRLNSDICYGNVIAFLNEDKNAVFVKRVAALPGDNVQIREGTLYVNNKVSDIFSELGVFSYAGLLEEAVVLDADEYIVIGDNIAESKDSRYEIVGIVKGDSILGKIICERKRQSFSDR